MPPDRHIVEIKGTKGVITVKCSCGWEVPFPESEKLEAHAQAAAHAGPTGLIQNQIVPAPPQAPTPSPPPALLPAYPLPSLDVLVRALYVRMKRTQVLVIVLAAVNLVNMALTVVTALYSSQWIPGALEIVVLLLGSIVIVAVLLGAWALRDR